MPPDDEYRAGITAAKLDSIASDVSEIKGMVKELTAWQIEVEKRLSAGAEKFKALEQRDTRGGMLSGAVGVVAAVLSGVIAELRR